MKRVLLFGATGTAGRATCRALTKDGHSVTVVVRGSVESARAELPDQVHVLQADIADLASLDAAFEGMECDVVVSCLASRTGAPDDAWRVDYQANCNILAAARKAGVAHMVLLSAICVQRPMLAFQEAKLAFEAELKSSGVDWTIVRPTAFFKSLSGQLNRLRAGRPFLVFGDGQLTACTPISDRDLGHFISNCITDPNARNAVLPIGGPKPAITPLEQGKMLFDALGMKPNFRHVPVGLLDAIITVLRVGGVFSKRLAAKAELAKIGRYYATESMLVWDSDKETYDADATPSFGSDSLQEHYRRLAAGDEHAQLGDHAVF